MEKHTKKPLKTQKEDVDNYQQLFRNIGANKRILIKGDPGIGKTTLARKLVFDWTNDEWANTELESIKLVFLVTLRYINSDQTIENMIRSQHKCFVENENIGEGLLRKMLQKCGQNCLVILEGYDEIPQNYNNNIEKILKNETIRDCHVLVTSRPNAVEEMESFMATIASIEGFSRENTRKYIEKVIEEESKRQAAFEYTENNVIQEMWRYPILVLFLSLLVNWDEIDLNTEALPVGEFYTRLLDCLYKRYIAERAKTQDKGEKEEILLKIGRLAFEGMLSNKVAYNKREVIETVGPEAFDYGILIGSEEYEGRRYLNESADIFVYFAHKSIQEYLAAKYFISLLSGTRKSVPDIIGGGKGLDFIQDNLMFFTFCGYFAKLSKECEEPASMLSRFANVLKNSSPKEKLLKYIQKALDAQKVTLENVAIYEESSWLFLESLPRCSHIQELKLKGMLLKVHVTSLLKGVSKTLKSLHLDSCTLDCSGGVEDSDVNFPKIESMKFSGESGAIHVLVSLAWKAVKTLDLKEYELDDLDIISISESNKCGQLPFVKEIKLGGNKRISNLVGCLLCTLWGSLQQLDFEDCNLTRDDILAIHKARTKGNLPSIDLTMTSFSSSGHIPVVPVMCGAWREQEVLDLRWGDKQDVMTIAESNRHGLLPAVMEIKLRGNENVSDQVNTLLGSKWPVLKSLNMEECNLTKDDISAIHEANVKGFLPSIDLTVKSLSSSGHIPVVPVMCGAWRDQEVLDLMQGDQQDVITIAEANRHGLLPSVKDIKGQDKIADTKQLSTLFSHPWKSLETLDLRNFNEQDMVTIAGATSNGLLPSVNQIISLERVAYTKQLGALFSHQCKWTLLEILDMRRCDKQDVITIVEANRHGLLPAVKEINLEENENISGQLGALLGTTPWKVLQKLNLDLCSLTVLDLEALEEAKRSGMLPAVKEISKVGTF